jgi:hypothetical protein
MEGGRQPGVDTVVRWAFQMVEPVLARHGGQLYRSGGPPVESSNGRLYMSGRRLYCVLAEEGRQGRQDCTADIR